MKVLLSLASVVLLVAFATVQRRMNLEEARALLRATPQVQSALKRGSQPVLELWGKDAESFGFHVYARNCSSPSCTIGNFSVFRETATVCEVAPDRPIHSPELNTLQEKLRRRLHLHLPKDEGTECGVLAE